MTAPSFNHPTDVRVVADGRFAPVTCSACGCRLHPDDDATGEPRWYHFGPLGGRDARGCRVPCADLAHDQAGVASAAGETNLLVGGGWR